MGMLNERIDLKKVVSVATDGAPAMMGRERTEKSCKCNSKTVHGSHAKLSKDASCCILADITFYLNDLKLKLQEKNNVVCGLMSAVRAFQRKVEVFKSDLQCHSGSALTNR
ncbi:hypothetical protein N1851_031499 [Merluccius polli]|uniref:Uncharacterized protein n=1 Tax=Merluccius polli TaxID=89951 RepID=A0AA47NPY7_MERPO|nr:hypothetical protein N1851_031499 [Merluccius polli]